MIWGRSTTSSGRRSSGCWQKALTNGRRSGQAGPSVSNTALHEYYIREGFEFCGFCETIEGYPSAALFQKPVHEIKPSEDPLFWENSGPYRDDRYPA